MLNDFDEEQLPIRHAEDDKPIPSSKPKPPPPPPKAPRSLQDLLASRTSAEPSSSSSTSSLVALAEPDARGAARGTGYYGTGTGPSADQEEGDLAQLAKTPHKGPSSRPSAARHEEVEQEMPSQSMSVMPEETDLMALLSSPQYQPSHPMAANEDAVELYSTIAMLKRENSELTKEVQFLRVSKDAQLADLASKLEHTQQMHSSNAQAVPAMRKELAHANECMARLEAENHRLHEHVQAAEAKAQDLQAALIQKEDDLNALTMNRSSDVNSLRSDCNNMKLEINKLKMESSVLKAREEKALRDAAQLQADLGYRNAETEKMIASHQKEINDLQLDKRRAEDQLQVMRAELTDRGAQISKLTNDLAMLESNYNLINNEYNACKQKVFQLEGVQREHANAKFHVGHMENNYNHAQMEVNSLKQQLSVLQGQYQQAMSSLSSMSGAAGGAPMAAQVMPTYKPMPMPVEPISVYKPTPYQSSQPPMQHAPYGQHNAQAAAPQMLPQMASYPEPAPYRGAPRSLGSAIQPPAAAPAQSQHSGGTSLANAMARKPQGSGSLASLLTNHGTPVPSNTPPNNKPRSSPYATEHTAVSIMNQFDAMERVLTGMMAEKNSLQDEAEK